MTRSRSPGKDAIGNCTTPVTIPDRDSLNMRTWRKIENEGRQLFKLYLPRISERNGPICCYRVFLVKLAPQTSVSDLPPPEEINVYSYSYAHSSPTGAAYAAEAFDSDQLTSEIFLGDGISSNGSVQCNRCIGLRAKGPPSVLHFVPETEPPTTTINGTTTTIFSTVPTTTFTSPKTKSTTIDQKIESTTPTTIIKDSTESTARKKREDSSNSKTIVNEKSLESSPPPIQDGFLDERSNYTGFIEVIGWYKFSSLQLMLIASCSYHIFFFLVFSSTEDRFLPAYSGYFNPLYGGIDLRSIVADEVTMLETILQISIVLLVIIMIPLIALCILHKYTKRAQQRGEEIITLRNSFR